MRWGTSGAYDPLGRPRATRDAFEDDDRVLIGRIPAVQVPTVCAATGDLVPWAGLGVVAAAAVVAIRRRTTPLETDVSATLRRTGR
ncbi:MAG: hypothetical protein ABMB14_25330 [Myxococcota bacterium]